MQLWTQNLNSLLNLFLKSNCPLCQRSTPQEFCLDCDRQLQKCCLLDPGCLWQNPLPVFAWGTYSGKLKQAITAMKYENQPQIARHLGKSLGEAWQLNAPKCDRQLVVVPIPLHANKQKQRGYNQAALIAQSFCNTTGFKLKVNGLERIRETKPQFRLSVSKREENLTQAFILAKNFPRRLDIHVLLIDDVYTTGATARSAVQTFRQHGIAVLGLAAAATTQGEGETKT